MRGNRKLDRFKRWNLGTAWLMGAGLGVGGREWRGDRNKNNEWIFEPSTIYYFYAIYQHFTYIVSLSLTLIP